MRAFRVGIPNSLRRLQKNRVRRNFGILKERLRCFTLTSLNSYNLYVSRMRALNLFLTKSAKISRRISRKNRYRKMTGDDYIPKRFINKKKIEIFGFRTIKNIESARWTFRAAVQRSRFRWNMRLSGPISRTYICLNLRKIPFTRKPIGSRMGKGKGSIRAWFIRVRPGRRVIILRNWKTNKAIKVCRSLRLFLPGRNYITKPKIRRRRGFLSYYLNSI